MWLPSYFGPVMFSLIFLFSLLPDSQSGCGVTGRKNSFFLFVFSPLIRVLGDRVQGNPEPDRKTDNAFRERTNIENVTLINFFKLKRINVSRDKHVYCRYCV